MGASSRTDRLFNPQGRRHYRKNYDLREVPVGLAILLGLSAVGAWVAYKGAHPDPGLLALDVVPTGGKAVVAEGAPSAVASFGPRASPADRGPFPANLALDGWSEREVRKYDPDNLYVKINGRAGYYKSFGVQRLYFMSLEKDGDPSTVVDLELFDQGSVENAIGAYNGERGEENQPRVWAQGLTHTARNAMYLTVGKLYLRAVGSDETPPVLEQLERVQAKFQAELEGEPLPWSFALFVGRMSFKPGALQYYAENAYNFGFARQVHAVRLDGDTELFAALRSTPAEATAEARRLLDGFKEYGTETTPGFVQDQYIQTISAARARHRWVYGVTGAGGLKPARNALERLEQGLEGFSPPASAVSAAPGSGFDGVDVGAKENDGAEGYDEAEGADEIDDDGGPGAVDEE